jgi:hypothetical protein
VKVTLGTNEPKKIAILAGLVVVAGVVFWMNSGLSDVPTGRPAGPRPVAPLVAPQRPAATTAENTARPQRPGPRQRQLQEFRPSLKPKRPEDRPDPLTVDPAVRLDLLTRLQKVNVEGVHRSIFEFGTAPPPKPVASDAKKPVVPSPITDAAKAKEEAAKPPAPPPPPKIPLKFYGFTTAQVQQGQKRAFFVEGDCTGSALDCSVHVVTEGDVVKRQYRIVRIGVNSVVVEDIDQKNQQTLPLEEAPVG